uniref:HMA domain-containing protein n=1 Tax=Nelumbo nucifera TaxID=4432 RepID=A0A822ZI08_NELNU|nr:TPA_asm: hypothetical protein HUJ06_001325 [Nelumbo nucifera]
MKQKIVLKVEMSCQKCQTKALRVAAGACGVESVKLDGKEKDMVVVTGDGMDPVALTSTLRKKVGQTELVTLEHI